MSPPALVRVPIFPLAGALLFPRAHLPLHIFEPRYRAMVRDAMAGERLIAMVQPRHEEDPAELFEIGCLGRIVGCEELDDGRYNIVLHGISRIRIAAEADVKTPYRQVDGESASFDDEGDSEPLASIQRAEVEREARRFADAFGYEVEWEAVTRLDDEMLVNGIAQILPLDVAAKQALLEAELLATRADLLVQFMQFQLMAAGAAARPERLQ